MMSLCKLRQRPHQANPNETKSTQAKPSQATPSQLKPGEVKPNQVNQVVRCFVIIPRGMSYQSEFVMSCRVVSSRGVSCQVTCSCVMSCRVRHAVSCHIIVM